MKSFLEWGRPKWYIIYSSIKRFYSRISYKQSRMSYIKRTAAEWVSALNFIANAPTKSVAEL